MDNPTPPRHLSNDELLLLLLRVVLPILADAFSGNLSPHAMRKFSTLFAEYPLALPDTFEWGSELPPDPTQRKVIIGLERVVHRLRYAGGEDVSPELAEALC